MARRNIITETILKNVNGHRDAYVNQVFLRWKNQPFTNEIYHTVENYKYHTYLIIS